MKNKFNKKGYVPIFAVPAGKSPKTKIITKNFKVPKDHFILFNTWSAPKNEAILNVYYMKDVKVNFKNISRILKFIKKKRITLKAKLDYMTSSPIDDSVNKNRDTSTFKLRVLKK